MASKALHAPSTEAVPSTPEGILQHAHYEASNYTTQQSGWLAQHCLETPRLTVKSDAKWPMAGNGKGQKFYSVRVPNKVGKFSYVIALPEVGAVLAGGKAGNGRALQVKVKTGQPYPLLVYTTSVCSNTGAQQTDYLTILPDGSRHTSIQQAAEVALAKGQWAHIDADEAGSIIAEAENKRMNGMLYGSSSARRSTKQAHTTSEAELEQAPGNNEQAMDVSVVEAAAILTGSAPPPAYGRMRTGMAAADSRKRSSGHVPHEPEESTGAGMAKRQAVGEDAAAAATNRAPGTSGHAAPVSAVDGHGLSAAGVGAMAAGAPASIPNPPATVVRRVIVRGLVREALPGADLPAWTDAPAHGLHSSASTGLAAQLEARAAAAHACAQSAREGLAGVKAVAETAGVDVSAEAGTSAWTGTQEAVGLRNEEEKALLAQHKSAADKLQEACAKEQASNTQLNALPISATAAAAASRVNQALTEMMQSNDEATAINSHLFTARERLSQLLEECAVLSNHIGSITSRGGAAASAAGETTAAASSAGGGGGGGGCVLLRSLGEHLAAKEAALLAAKGAVSAAEAQLSALRTRLRKDQVLPAVEQALTQERQVLSMELSARERARSAAAAEEARLRHQLSAALHAQVDACVHRVEQLHQAAQTLRSAQQALHAAEEQARQLLA